MFSHLNNNFVEYGYTRIDSIYRDTIFVSWQPVGENVINNMLNHNNQ